MSHPIPRQQLVSTDQLAPPPQLRPNLRQGLETRNFDLPVGLHLTYFGLLFAYLGVMFVGFRSPQMVLPMAIFVIFLIGFLAVPALWSRMRPAHEDRPLTLSALMAAGVVTHTGRCPGDAAAVQVLLLPVLILGWGCAVTVIAAAV